MGRQNGDTDSELVEVGCLVADLVGAMWIVWLVSGLLPGWRMG